MRSIRRCLIRGKGAFPREVGDLIRFQAKVIAIHQTDRGVTVHGTNYGNRLEARADWCVRLHRRVLAG